VATGFEPGTSCPPAGPKPSRVTFAVSN
jgi:hypothetical protein